MTGLDRRQAELVQAWFPGARLVADMSWGLVDSTVLHLATGDEEIVVKAGGPRNAHIARDITAHETVVPRLAARGFAPRLLRADRDARILVHGYVPGDLVDDGPSESDPDVIREAGEILSLLHSLGGYVDESIEAQLISAGLKWLRKPTRIPAAQSALAQDYLAGYKPRPVWVVPSHGDYSGRNWVRTESGIAVIDFGRFGYRPRRQDFLRMFFRRWHDHPAERELFLAGYGEEAEADGVDWWIDVLREAVSTAGWAHKVGDEPFERLGLRYVEIALDALGSP